MNKNTTDICGKYSVNFTNIIYLPNIRRCMFVMGLNDPQASKTTRVGAAIFNRNGLLGIFSSLVGRIVFFVEVLVQIETNLIVIGILYLE